MIKSPIKWAGGKTRVMPQLLKHLLKADCLIEPFVGSGTVFMNTDYRRYVLCDNNRALINFFRVLTSDTERLIDTARGMFLGGNNEEQYYKRRALFNSMQWSDTGKADAALLYATLFLYLNRHCFNGVYRVNQLGEHNVPFGKYAAPYFPADEMHRFAEKAKDTKAVFIDGDFRHTIPDVMQLAYDAVIYCDPPLHPGQQNRKFHCLRQAVHAGRPSCARFNPARCSSPARHPRGYLKQRHPRDPQDLLRFQSPRLQCSPLCQRQKPRHGWRGYWRASRMRSLWSFWRRQLPVLQACKEAFHLRRNGGGGCIRRDGGILMNEPVWLAADPADESEDCTIVTALVYRITGSQQYHTFTLIDFRAFILDADVPLFKSCVSGIGSDDQGIKRGGLVRLQLVSDSPDEELPF